MPHLTLEHSGNVLIPDPIQPLLLSLHDLMRSLAGTGLDNCKSRVYRAETYLVGGGEASSGFVHLEIALLEGRTPAVKKRIASGALDLLRNAVLPLNTELNVQLTVDIRDLDREAYAKHPPGTLSMRA